MMYLLSFGAGVIVGVVATLLWLYQHTTPVNMDVAGMRIRAEQ